MTSPEMPIYYPVFLDLHGKPCVVVGGGAVARRKVEGLVEAGADVTVIAPDVQPMPPAVRIVPRAVQPGDLDGAMLIIAATDDPVVNAAIAREAATRHIFVNVVDAPADCSMILPAVVRRGALRIAISTAGASPSLARRLREELEARFGEEYGALVALLAQLRQHWEPTAIKRHLPDAQRREAWDAVLDLPLLAWLRDGKHQEARKAAAAILAEKFSNRKKDTA